MSCLVFSPPFVERLHHGNVTRHHGNARPLALPRPCAAGALDTLKGIGREERIARVICYGGDEVDSASCGGSSRASECSVPPQLVPQLSSLDSMGWLGRPLAIFAALLASHFGVLLLGMYLGGRQQNAELTCLLRRFSSVVLRDGRGASARLELAAHIRHQRDEIECPGTLRAWPAQHERR